MTHITQLALMVVWAGSALKEDAWVAWGRMTHQDSTNRLLSGYNACDHSGEGAAIGMHGVELYVPTCPRCAVLLDEARELAPVSEVEAVDEVR